jgi:hypothetical protein
MSTTSNEYYEKKFAELKRAVILRQQECEAIGKMSETLANSLGPRNRKINLLLIILGALITTKGVADLIMLTLDIPKWANMLILVIYTVIGIVVTILATVQAGSPHEGLKDLAADCHTYNIEFMADYLEYRDERDPAASIERIKVMIKAQSDILQILRKRAGKFSDLDLSKIPSSYLIEPTA